MELSTSVVNNTTPSPEKPTSDNTVTFLIGFGVLLIFVFVGILASVFLCVTLKKDPYLWDAERERQLQEKGEGKLENGTKERDKAEMEERTSV